MKNRFPKTQLIRKLPMGAIFKGRALSNSMSPLINIDDLIEIKKLPFQQLKKGDVIAFNRGKAGKFHLHRILKLNWKKHIVITKGDNLERQDKPVSPRQYLGKAISVKKEQSTIPLEGFKSKLFGYHLYSLFPRKLGLRKFACEVEFYSKEALKRVIF